MPSRPTSTTLGGPVPTPCAAPSRRSPRRVARPLVVADDADVLGVIELKDVVKGGIKERFAELRRMGIKTVMITGDNPLTAAAIAAEAGVDDFLAEATPEAKLQADSRPADGRAPGRHDRRRHQRCAGAGAGRRGGCDELAELRRPRRRETWSTSTRIPTKLIEIVKIGKQLLMTRGALTTFSIANDVAKYFAILPAAFAATYPALGALDVMRLATPSSAILSAVIFNALIIVALVPLALRGVKYRPRRRSPAAAQQPVDLRLGWSHRSVHRYQGHRPVCWLPWDWPKDRACRWTSTEHQCRQRIFQGDPRCCVTCVFPWSSGTLDAVDRCDLPVARDRDRQQRVPAPGQRQHSGT